MNLFARKLLVTFLAVFLPIFLTGLIAQLDDVIAWASGTGDLDFGLMRATLLALLAGAGAAGARAVLAYFLTIVPSDALHGPGHQEGAVLVTKGGSGHPQ